MDLAPGGNANSATGSHQPRKLCCLDSSVTIPEYYQSSFDKLPHKKALCWKDNKDGPWKSLTYGEYKKLIFSVAKSLLKVCS